MSDPTTPECEFCQQPDGEPPAMLNVCPSCWNDANKGSGWMQRALKAEAALVAPPAEAAQRIVELEKMVEALERMRKEEPGTKVLQAVLDAISGKLDTNTQIADHPNVKFAQMERLKLLSAPAVPGLREQIEKIVQAVA